MKRKLELKHLAPYLPFNLKTLIEQDTIQIPEILMGLEKGTANKVLGYYGEFGSIEIVDIKPILRPLSDLTKEIDHNGEEFYPYLELLKGNCFDVDNFTEEQNQDWIRHYRDDMGKDPELMMFSDVQQLFEWHFDVFELIPEGLAIDINTLES